MGMAMGAGMGMARGAGGGMAPMMAARMPIWCDVYTGGCGYYTGGCGYYSYGCGFYSWGCGYTCDVITCRWGTGTITWQVQAADPAGQLAALKQQLQEAISAVQRQEQAASEAGKPATVEEAEMLERKLSEALEEVRSRKAELERRRKGSAKS